ncbi:hypothetical protein MAJ_11057, partial [Metarhizium majus ARSEF 297]
MKSIIVLHFLAGVVLTAPQPRQVARDVKPFHEVPTDFTGCFQNDNPFLPGTPIQSEKCTGTMTYCFRRLYNLPENKEHFTSTDECLRSRNKNPDTLDAQPILDETDYKAGVLALDNAANDYRMFAAISPDYKDWAAKVMSRANKGLDTVQEKLKTALSPEIFGKVDTDIKDAKEKLNIPGINVKEIGDNLKKLRDWIRNTTTEKYMVLPALGWYTIPY